jgi:acetyl-CoA carboxylase carboxyltransferase component
VNYSSPFLELSQLAAYNCYNPDEIMSAGIVTGIGSIHG